MSRFSCPRCGYETMHISNFKKHLNLKQLCNPLLADTSLEDLKLKLFNLKSQNSFICKFCEGKFASQRTLSFHIKTKHADENNLKHQIKLMSEEINALKNKVASLESNNKNNTIIINGPVKNQNFFLSPNSFLHEDIDYINSDFALKCARQLNNGLIDFIKTIRFNPEHPENMNVKVHRLKQKTLYVYKEDRWQICDAKWTLEEMIIHGARILNQQVLTNIDKDKLIEEGSSEHKIQTWLLSLLPRNNEKLIGILSKRLYALILDNKLLLMEQEEFDQQEKVQ